MQKELKHLPAAEARRLTKTIWQRDGRKCFRCESPIAEKEAFIDHIDYRPVRPSSAFKNVRICCERCYILRCYPGMGMVREGKISGAIGRGVIDADWRPQVWEG